MDKRSTQWLRWIEDEVHIPVQQEANTRADGAGRGDILQKLREQIEGDTTVRGGPRLWLLGVAVAVAVGTAYFLAAQLSLALLTAAERVAVLWPASGVAAGTLIALGRRAWMPVAVGVIAATVAANILVDRSLLSAVAFGLCNAVEAVLVMWLIERWFGPRFNLDNLRRVLGFLAAAAVATATAALGASGAMKLFGPSTGEFLDVWGSGSRLTRSAS